MRRSSVIAPLLLILIGLLFLFHNLWPEIQVMDMLSRYWPFLLILWGALRLIEILVWAATSQPLPRSGISGGEWVLVILLSLFGAGLYTARHYSGWLPNGRSLRGMVINMGESFDYQIAPVSKTIEQAPRIVIENFRGNARITGTAGDKVTASGRKTVRAFQQPEADKANRDTPLELIAQGGSILVRTNQNRVDNNLRVSSDLEIAVPKGSTIEAHGRMGDFDIRDIDGNVEISSDNAGVRIDNLGGSLRVDLRRSDIVRATGVKGAVELKGRGQDVELQNIDGRVSINGEYIGQIQLRNISQPVRFEGARTDLQCEKAPGQIHMGPGEFTAHNIIGPIRLTSRARDVQLSEFTQSLEMDLERGDVDLRPGQGSSIPKMEVHVKSGDINLAIPPAAKFELRVATKHGQAHNEYGEPLKEDEQRHGANITGSVGLGPQLRLDTDRGNISVRKSGSEELKVEQQ